MDDKISRALGLALSIGVLVMLHGFDESGLTVLTAGQAQEGETVTLRVEPTSRASYRVREQLAGISFPNDAVGFTDAVQGSLVIRPDGSIDAANSRLVVDLRNLQTDQARRDNYVRRNVLQTDDFPEAVFVPRRAVGLAWPLPIPQPRPAPGASGAAPAPAPQGRPASPPAAGSRPGSPVGFQLVGEMTIHGVTKEMTWDVVASVSVDGGLHGKAMTSFPFAMFDMTVPRVATVLSVEDDIRLEIDFHLARSTGE